MSLTREQNKYIEEEGLGVWLACTVSIKTQGKLPIKKCRGAVRGR
jgi:hypothetical protein